MTVYENGIDFCNDEEIMNKNMKLHLTLMVLCTDAVNSTLIDFLSGNPIHYLPGGVNISYVLFPSRNLCVNTNKIGLYCLKP
jgi:hypothetical protein